jgi:SprB repeat
MKFIPFVMIAFMFALTNCEYNDLKKPLDCGSLHLMIKVTSKTDALCGQSNASIRVVATGGTGNYTFSINNGTPQQDSVFQNLEAGSYVLSVKDNSCASSVAEEIVNQNGLNITVSATNADCNSANGSISVTPSGGEAPITFSLNAGSFTSSANFDHLPQGAYSLVAKDASGCSISKSIQIASKASFANDISLIISTNCAVSGCHKGTGLPDFSTLKNIQANATAIESQTGSRNMPIGKTLTQDQINVIACWVNDGAIDN